MVSPGAETHLGRKFELLCIIFYPKYFDSTDSRPVDRVGFRNRVLGMVGAEYKSPMVVKVDGHLSAFSALYDTRPANKKVPN